MRFKKLHAAKEQINARVSESLKQRLQAVCMQLQQSESEAARQAIEQWVAAQEQTTNGN